jgi:dTDP-4-dehydrorhamnose reductase
MRLLVLVLGAGGQLGEVIADQLARNHEVIARPRAELDVADGPALRAAITSICPDAIINCSAYTNVDAAEDHPLEALSVNAFAVQTMARAATEVDATLVHYSTDFVFDGTQEAPYIEDDAVNPQGNYASSKLLGEWFAAETARHYIIRVESLFGGPRAKSSVDKLLDGITAGRDVRAFSDRTVSPSYVGDVSHATAMLLQGRAPYGLYHCVNSGSTTWSALARELAHIVDAPHARIIDVPMADAALVAPRPQFATLSNAKLASVGVIMPSWQDALRRYLKVTK